MYVFNEFASLAHMLEQSTSVVNTSLWLVQSNEEVLYQTSAKLVQTECTHEPIWRQLQVISSGDVAELECTCKQKLFAFPVSSANEPKVYLLAYPPEPNHHAFISGLASLIGDFLLVSQNAVSEWRKNVRMLNLNEALVSSIDSAKTKGELIRVTLATLVEYLEADQGICVLRNEHDKSWDIPALFPEKSLSNQWIENLIDEMGKMDYLPLLWSSHTQLEGYDLLRDLTISSLISVTISQQNVMQGRLIFCRLNHSEPFTTDEFDLLESQREIFTLRLQALDLKQERQDFLERAFHAIKTPVHSIKNIVEILTTIPQLQDHTYIPLLQQQGERLGRLTDKTLELARRRRTSLPKCVDVSLNQIIRDCASVHQTIADPYDITIRSHLPEENCRVIANTDDLFEAIEYLLDNSLKVSEQGQVIDIVLEPQEQDYRIYIIDMGPGVPIEQREIIFHEFESIPRKLDVPESSGLGLPIARQIIEKYGGRLEYKDRLKGACFQFILPREFNKGDNQ